MLRTEALEQFAEQKKSDFFAKLFRSAQVELEKERFINQYLAKHLSKRLNQALRDYHETPELQEQSWLSAFLQL